MLRRQPQGFSTPSLFFAPPPPENALKAPRSRRWFHAGLAAALLVLGASAQAQQVTIDSIAGTGCDVGQLRLNLTSSGFSHERQDYSLKFSQGAQVFSHWGFATGLRKPPFNGSEVGGADRSNHGMANASFPMPDNTPVTVEIVTIDKTTRELASKTTATLDRCGPGASITANSGPVAVTGTAPDMVRPTALAGDGQATLNWSAPDAGSSPILGYYVTYVERVGANPWRQAPGCAPTTATTCTVTGLTNGTEYLFAVLAYNAAGEGLHSDAMSMVTPVAGSGGPYTITANVSPAGAGTIVCSPHSVPHGGNSSCTATANAGYTFSGFTGCDAVSGTSCALTNVTGPRAVVAAFDTTYTVSASVIGGNGTVAPASQGVLHGNSATFTLSPATGYGLDTVSGTCPAGSSTSTSVTTGAITGDCAVQVSFKLLPPSTHAITTSANPTAGGGVTCTPNPVPNGGNATCTATANAGYTFTAFGGDCSGTSCTLTNVTSPKTVSATFTATPGTHAITTSANPTVGGSVSCTPNPVPNGGNATCTATANAGYTFTAFGGDCSGTTCALTNVTSPKTVSATFTAVPGTHAITIAPMTGGSVTCSPDPVPNGGDTTCTATPDLGYQFAGFTGDCAAATGPVCTLSNVTAAVSLGALFTIAPGPTPTDAQPVPTLGLWSLLLLALAAAGIGSRALRRQEA